MKFSIKDFFSKCDQIRSFLKKLKKSLMESFIFCAVRYIHIQTKRADCCQCPCVIKPIFLTIQTGKCSKKGQNFDQQYGMIFFLRSWQQFPKIFQIYVNNGKFVDLYLKYHFILYTINDRLSALGAYIKTKAFGQALVCTGHSIRPGLLFKK